MYKRLRKYCVKIIERNAASVQKYCSGVLCMHFPSSSRDHDHHNNLTMTSLSFDLQIVSLQNMSAMSVCCIKVVLLLLRLIPPRNSQVDVKICE